VTYIGGLSFYTPQYGPVCSNILSYEIVLASGAIVTASASTNPDLWRALKGGSNNFGIVTRFTARSFPSSKIWSGFLWLPGFQAPKVLAAFHEAVNQVNVHDSHAAGPMACFSYVQQLGIQVISVYLVYTKHPKGNKWPVCWKNSSFGSLWRLWSTCKVRTLTSAHDELHSVSPYGLRQVFATTTIKNDPATITAVHAAYCDAISLVSRVKNMAWTFVLQPFLPEWARKGDATPLGIDNGTNEPLVIVGFSINWTEGRDDKFVQDTTRSVIEQIDAVAATNGTGHRYRFLNYCAEWQRPFESYGEENWRFLKEVSKKYDPEGLFQKGCIGGFKLEVEDSTS
jgi:FAD/FMN-containing dehydrogenase